MDMTTGKPYKIITRFAIPLIFGNMMQQLYVLINAMVVGQALGYKSLAAVGAADWLAWFMTSVINGITMGYCTKASQEKGKKDRESLLSVSAMCILITIILSVILVIAGQFAAMPALKLLDTPDDIIRESYSYLRIIYLALPFSLFYNTFSALLRADGDSRTPFTAMIVSSLVNAALDILFVLGMKAGVAGAACATAVAQMSSMIICLVKFLKNENLRFEKRFLRPDPAVMKSILRYSLPMAFQFCIVSTSGLFTQYLTNRQGSVFIAGYTAANKYYGLIEMGAIAIAAALLTYTGQNYGAGDYRRIKQGIKTGVIASAIVSGVITIALLLFRRPMLSLFISAEPEEYAQIFHYANQFLLCLGCPLFILYLHHSLRSILQGMGDVMTPIYSGCMQFIFRVGTAYLVTSLIGSIGVFIAEPAAWFGSVCYLSVRLIFVSRKTARQLSE